MVNWFRNFSAVPGIGYKGNPGLYHPQIPEQALLPKSGSYPMGDTYRNSVSWPMLSGTGITSASPVQQWTTQPRDGESPAQTRLRQLYEALELPGKLLEYHFAIQVCCSVLSGLHAQAPSSVKDLATVCWLDIGSIEAYPAMSAANN